MAVSWIKKKSRELVLYASIIGIVCNSIHLLLIGDSVDRYITWGWCDSMADKGVTRGVFAEDLIKYRPGPNNIGAYRCLSHSTNDSIGFIHIFGSNATGPYMYRNGPEFVGPLMDSPGRIRAAMKLYYDTFPHPDRIFFNSILWDLQLLRQVHNGSLDEQQCASWFQSNLNDRIDEIKKLVVDLTSLSSSSSSSSPSKSRGATIGLKTAVIDRLGQKKYGMSQFPSVSFFEKFNDIVKVTADRRNLSFFDFHHDVLSTVNWNESMRGMFLKDVRDPQHPNSHHSARAGDKLLSRLYSRYAVFRDSEIQSNVPVKSDHTFQFQSNITISDLHQLMSRMNALFVTSDRRLCSTYGAGWDEREPSQQHNNDSRQGKIFLLIKDRSSPCSGAGHCSNPCTSCSTSTHICDNHADDSKPLQQLRLHGPVTYAYTLMKLWKYGCGDVMYLDEGIMSQMMPSLSAMPSALTDGSIGSSQFPQSNMITHTHPSQISQSNMISHPHPSNSSGFIDRSNFVGIMNTTLGQCFVFWQHNVREISTPTALALIRLTTLPIHVEHQVSSCLMGVWPRDEGGGLADVYGENTLYQLIVNKHSKDIFVNIAGQRRLVSTPKALQRLKLIDPTKLTPGSTSTSGTTTTAAINKEVIPIFPYQFLDILPLGKPIVE